MNNKQQIPKDIKEESKCKKCGKKISEANKYSYKEMCDNCFFDTYFPELNIKKEQLIEKLRPFWKKYWKLQSKFSTKTEELENEMNKELILGIKLEFFHCDGEVAGIGAEDYSERERFPLIHDSDLNE